MRRENKQGQRAKEGDIVKAESEGEKEGEVEREREKYI